MAIGSEDSSAARVWRECGLPAKTTIGIQSTFCSACDGLPDSMLSGLSNFGLLAAAGARAAALNSLTLASTLSSQPAEDFFASRLAAGGLEVAD